MKIYSEGQKWRIYLEPLYIFCFSLHHKHVVRVCSLFFKVFCLFSSMFLRTQPPSLFPEAVRIKSTPGASAEGFIQAKPDDTVSLICEITDTNLQEEELNWQRNGAAVSLTDTNKNTPSAVCITPVIPEDDEATFTCSLRKNSTASASVTLKVSCESIYQTFYKFW